MRLIILIFAIFVSNIYVNAQNNIDYRYKKTQIYHNVISQPKEFSMKGVGDSLLINIQFRIHHNELLFISENNIQKAFVSYSFAIRNDDNIIIKRFTFFDTLTSTNSNTINEYLYYFKNFSFVLANNNYSYEIELNQPERSNLYSKKGKISEFNTFKENDKISNPILAYKYNNRYFASVLDSAIDFRAESFCFFFPIYNFSEKQLKFNVSSIETKKNIGFNISQDVNINIDAEIISKMIFLNNFGDNEILFANNTSPIKYIKLEIPRNLLFPGNYKLSYDDNVFNFSIDYIDQPSSLKNINFAIKAMSLILPNELVKALENSKDKYKYIFEYFKPLDTNPNTLYNEAMNEYFRRIDYATINYSDFDEVNGYNTARGRIYILYGLPDNIEIENHQNYSIEVWKYLKLNKEIKFELKNSAYKLLK